MLGHTHANVGEVMRGFTCTVRVEGTRRAIVRLCLLRWILRLAAVVSPLGLRIEWPKE